MKTLIRTINLNKLLNIPLSNELTVIDNAYTILEDILNNCIIKDDKNKKLYMFNNNCYFYQLTTGSFWVGNDIISNLNLNITYKQLEQIFTVLLENINIEEVEIGISAKTIDELTALFYRINIDYINGNS